MEALSTSVRPASAAVVKAVARRIMTGDLIGRQDLADVLACDGETQRTPEEIRSLRAEIRNIILTSYTSTALKGVDSPAMSDLMCEKIR